MTKTGITIYGCEQDEAMLFQKISSHFNVTPTITGAGISNDNISLSLGNKCISVSHKTEISKPILLALGETGVKYISTRSVGYNHIDIKTAEKVGITVGNVIYSPDSVADYTVMLMLMAMRNVKSIISRADNHDFSLNSIRGKELRDITVGVIGTGHIGKAVIERLKGFGCRVLAFDHYPKITADYVPLEELLKESDIVTLHTPFNTGTYHLINSYRIAQMKDGAFIINTGRGQLIDTDALIQALESCKLGGVALDVLEGEEGIFYFDCSQKPIENEQLLRLQAMPNVIITPHVAYHTKHALQDTIEKTIINCLNFKEVNHG